MEVMTYVKYAGVPHAGARQQFPIKRAMALLALAIVLGLLFCVFFNLLSHMCLAPYNFLKNVYNKINS